MTFASFKLLAYLICFVGLFIIACEKWDFEKVPFTQVITVGSLEVGFNSAFLLGDIQGLRNGTITETGFLYTPVMGDDQSLQLEQSDVAQVTSPTSVDGSISSDRAFAARVSNLDEATKYFFRAYIRLDGNEVAYGTIDTFVTSSLTISSPAITKDFNDCSGEISLGVNLLGAAPSPDVSFGIVWSDIESNLSPTSSSGFVELTDVVDQSGNIVIPLTIECDKVYSVRGFYKTPENERYGPVTVFSTHAGGRWIEAGLFPEDFNRDRCFHSFSSDSSGYVLGLNPDQTEFRLWQFHPQNESWVGASAPPPLSGQRCSRPVATLGRILFDSGAGPFAEYLSKNDQWIILQPISIFDGSTMVGDFVFLNSGIFYWGFGLDRSNNIIRSEVYKGLDGGRPNQITDYPGSARHQTTYFILDKKGYVGLGRDISGKFFNDFWALDLGSALWSPVADLEAEINSTQSFTRDGKAYILTGYDANGRPIPNFHEYNPEEDKWIRLADFASGDGNSDIAFAIHGIIYGGLGISTSGEVRRTIWRYVDELK
ncbi:MAG: hypothetical protein HKN76_06085 [Saprospiraceae bacterium]|nr:hypothetical protein [Saprospiraceae bacterium]